MTLQYSQILYPCLFLGDCRKTILDLFCDYFATRHKSLFNKEKAQMSQMSQNLGFVLPVKMTGKERDREKNRVKRGYVKRWLFCDICVFASRTAKKQNKKNNSGIKK